MEEEKKDPRFDINPHVIRQLGAELVTDQVTALMELIKNSYDADANYVKVTIETDGVLLEDNLFHKNHKGYIVVDDDGFGMDRSTILKSWLIISYSNKREVNGIKPKTPKGRTPLGDKGLGRLSTQRLADICEIFTKKKEGETLHVGFDWNDFDKATKLSDVNVDFQKATLNKKEGTKLVLLNLSDEKAWEGTNLERFKALLCQLISPYQENRPFQVYLHINGESVNLDQESEKLHKLSLADIQFNYQDESFSWHADISMRKLIGNDFDTYEKLVLADNGKRFLDSFFNDKKGRASNFRRDVDDVWLKVEHTFSLASIFDPKSLFNTKEHDPGNFFGRIQEFTFQKNSKSEDWWSALYATFDQYKSFIEPQKGIKIYRNGFAIRPYGINSNDWLKLGASWTGGSSYYGLRPDNVVGYVSIDEGVNSHLKDKTDREGLIENDYSRAFFGLLDYFIKAVNREFENLRRFYNDFRKEMVQDNHKVKSMSDAFNAIQEQATKGTEISKSYDEVQKKFETIKKHVQKVVRSEKDGLFAQSEDSLSHQTLQEVSELMENSQSILFQANEVLRNSVYLNEALVVLKPKLDSLEENLRDMTELASLGLISEMVSHDLGQVADRMLGKSKEIENQIKQKREITTEQIYSIVSFIKSTVTALRSQMKHLDSSMKYNRLKIEEFSLYDMLEKEEGQYYIERLKNNDIDFVIDCKNDFVIKANKGKIIQVFDNLMNNSIYWLHSRKDDKRIVITIDKPWVYFEDNGPGIDQSVENTLFSPFVTCKPEGQGRGLGLFIIQQLLDDSNCDIVLDKKRNTDGRRFRFSINFYGLIVK
ncbi:MAG: sensor histidine kinase [Bacteroidales bacterium]|nr:sensor histidine kinase [Bacteroidales bacterium]